jgi:hypothetical protein
LSLNPPATSASRVWTIRASARARSCDNGAGLTAGKAFGERWDLSGSVNYDRYEADTDTLSINWSRAVGRHKEFVPYVLVLRVGSSVKFLNKDDIRDHVYSFSPAKRFELPLYGGTPATPVLFDKVGVVKLKREFRPRRAPLPGDSGYR